MEKQPNKFNYTPQLTAILLVAGALLAIQAFKQYQTGNPIDVFYLVCGSVLFFTFGATEIVKAKKQGIRL